MPEMTKGRRGSGPHGLPRHGHIPELDDRPPLRMPDQSRYGTATTDPLGREGHGWVKSKATGLPARDKNAD